MEPTASAEASPPAGFSMSAVGAGVKLPADHRRIDVAIAGNRDQRRQPQLRTTQPP